jgi:hypothetical protein
MTEEKKANHRAPVVLLAASMFRPHPDPDTTNLELIDVENYQVVVRKDQFKVGDLAVYIQPDSVVPQTEAFRFIWNDHIGLDGTVPEKRRRITVRKFRGQWSEGLLLPLSDFGTQDDNYFYPYGGGWDNSVNPPVRRVTFPSFNKSVVLVPGYDVSELLGITHYDPDADKQSTKGETANAPKVKKRRYPRTLRGWFNFIWRRITFHPNRRDDLTQDVSFHLPVYDVEGYKNYKDALQEGETVVMTEKIHGSNARFICLDGVIYVGSRNQWKAPGTGTVWHKALEQNPWIEEWLKKFPGHALYGEVTPTQAKFNYGCKPGDVKFFVFDIFTPENKWVDFNDFTEYDFRPSDTRRVPFLYFGPFSKEILEDKATGNSLVPGARHIREGVVAKPIVGRHAKGLGRVQLKLVSNKFLEVDGKV